MSEISNNQVLEQVKQKVKAKRRGKKGGNAKKGIASNQTEETPKAKDQQKPTDDDWELLKMRRALLEQTVSKKNIAATPDISNLSKKETPAVIDLTDKTDGIENSIVVDLTVDSETTMGEIKTK